MGECFAFVSGDINHYLGKRHEKHRPTCISASDDGDDDNDDDDDDDDDDSGGDA